MSLIMPVPAPRLEIVYRRPLPAPAVPARARLPRSSAFSAPSAPPRDVLRAIGWLLLMLIAALACWALLVGILVLGVRAARAQVQLQEQGRVIGQAYDHQGHEFPSNPKEGQIFEHFWWHKGKWSVVPVAPAVPVDPRPRKTVMYDCPYGQHYHPLAKDVASADWAQWQKKDVKYADAGLPALTGACFSDDFDQQLSPRQKRIK